MFLIAGGISDPNLDALAKAADRLGIEWFDLRQPLKSSLPFHWELDTHTGHAVCPWGDVAFPCSAFIRQDVFAHMNDPRPEVAVRALGSFTAVQGWLLANPSVRTFNSAISHQAHNKVAALILARQCGLEIPETWVSNHAGHMRERSKSKSSIAKPVAGGGYCQTLDEALESVNVDFSAIPALIQSRMVAPEIRIFVVGGNAFAFRVSSPSLDYRVKQDAQLEQVDVPKVIARLRKLMKKLRMNFGAADFKTNPDTGELVFLELNTSPMFAAFDKVSHGKLTESMVSCLCLD
ncbi:MAG: hypothetical protein LW710_09525 [Burkholderiales bacterium]|jgi:glutathione synthase/RimK-type ligase-like ATP-grasp enzyme|uniref:ATP-grasp domain-containing protein n=1 Tax=Limnobacter sp. TaxID=2003368 RepID=UPI00393526E3|nr:hypothetical protein [Burkholderiales bacterium]